MRPNHRILVVGVGSIGERHVRCFQRTGRAEVGICEIDATLREWVGRAYGTDSVHDDLDKALAQTWDAAVIATPANTHIALARQCVDAGLALLIEKPLAVRVDEAQSFVQQATHDGHTAAVAYVYRAHPALRAMRHAIGQQRFGSPLQLVAVSGQDFAYLRPGYAQTYYADHASGGGAMQDALTHVVNAAQWLVGPMTQLRAHTAHQSLPNVKVEDTVALLARHSEVPAMYALNQYQAPNENTITVVCERGTVRFDLHTHTWQWMTEPDQPWQSERIDFPQRDDWFTAQENAFLDVLEGKADPLCTLTEALQTLRVNQAALSSAQRGGELETMSDSLTEG